MRALTSSPSLEQLLDRQVEALDGIMAELRAGLSNQRHYDELEERAAVVSKNLRAAFRECAR